MRNIALMVLGTIFIVAASGCETAKGFKKDIQTSGEYAKQLPGQTKQFFTSVGHGLMKADAWFKENVW